MLVTMVDVAVMLAVELLETVIDVVVLVLASDSSVEFSSARQKENRQSTNKLSAARDRSMDFWAHGWRRSGSQALLAEICSSLHSSV